MTDCYEDKTSPYDIRLEDAGLIRAALDLGERLCAFPETTQKQKEAITTMLAFLRNLPAPQPGGFSGEFGFRFEAKDESLDCGHFGSWCVGVYRGQFEIFSCGRDERTELAWELSPGQENLNDMTTAATWAAQVANPRALLLPDQRLVVEASTWSDKE